MSHDMGLHSEFRQRLNAEMRGRYPQAMLDSVSLAYDGEVIFVEE